ncbi:MAG: SDR family NAD(P)-dependent oxidoreductase, partial [Sphingomonas sp.]
AVQAMMAAARDHFCGIDFLINNAAIIRDRTLAKMSDEEWRTVIDVNLSGVTITNANIKWLTIFGYDVGAMIKKALEDDGCHYDP